MQRRVQPLLVAGIVFGLLVGLGLYTFVYARGASYLTNDPAACANCHVMSEQYDGWLKSSHHAVAVCNDCHTPHNLHREVRDQGAAMASGTRSRSRRGGFPTRSGSRPATTASPSRPAARATSDIVHAIDVSGERARRRGVVRPVPRLGGAWP